MKDKELSMGIVEDLGFSGNPFEHYTAETEPNISEYAIRPPYLEAISSRAHGLTSFILFGDRGAGKSATRVTVYNECWNAVKNKVGGDQGDPIVANMTDFSLILNKFNKGGIEDLDLVSVVAFVVIEQVLVWLSSLEDEERKIYVGGLDRDEKVLAMALVEGFYLAINQIDRGVSTEEALRLLNAAWTSKSKVWINKKWDILGKIAASVAAALARKNIDESLDIQEAATELLKSFKSGSSNVPRAILTKLVDFVRIFGFSGICVLVDKLDETSVTSNSAEATTRLIYPLLSHIQLLEVKGFSWVLFIWENVQSHFNGKYAIRLDKIAHSNITWDNKSLRKMLESRISYFSNKAINFSGMLDTSIDADKQFEEFVDITVKSPRELIKLLDFIFREHDAREGDKPEHIDQLSIDVGIDKYCKETIGSWFDEKPLQQVYRLGKTSFVNKDVQSAFRIGDQGARVKIKGWEDAGLVKQSGTLPSEAGGKQVYRYIVADPRVDRIIERKLDSVVGVEIDADDV